MGVLVNYDLDGKHTPVKDAMKVKGYQDYFEFHEIVKGVRIKKRINLPNTTLYHNSKSASTGRDELISVAKEKGAIVEFILATQFDPETTSWASYGLKCI
jgi:hypothetical protein